MIDNHHNEPPPEPATPRLSRRSLLIGGTSATAAGVIGVAAGISVGEHAAPPAPRSLSSRQRFKDKVVMITGATSGIGRAAAIAFAREGAKVTFCGRRSALGHTVEQEITDKGGTAHYYQADVRNERDVQRFVDFTVAHFGRLDVAFNNAGITLEKPVHEYSSAEWDDVLNTNLRGVFYAIKYQVPVMLANGGNIVVTSSSNAIATQGKRGAYAASKRGLVALVQAAALEYGPHNIRINAMLPGTTDTPLVRRVAGMENAPDAVWKAGAAEWAKSHAPGLGRMANPEEIAEFALALASDEYPFLTGAALVIDGGKTAQGG